MQIEKTFTVAADRQQVWEFITSPEQVAACVPGCQGAERTGPGRYKATITTRVGPVKATFHVNIETTEERPPEFAAYQTTGEEGSRTSRLSATSTLALKRLAADQTEVTYVSQIKLMGSLGKLGAGMMEKVAAGIGDRFVAELRKRIEAEPAPATAAGDTAKRSPLRPWLIGGAVCAAMLVLAAWLLW